MQVRWKALVTGSFLALFANAAERNPHEKIVWQLEEDYWRFVSTGDVDAYVELWHDDFVGWPCFEWNPARKGDIGKWVREPRNISTTMAMAREAASGCGENSRTPG